MLERRCTSSEGSSRRGIFSCEEAELTNEETEAWVPEDIKVDQRPRPSRPTLPFLPPLCPTALLRARAASLLSASSFFLPGSLPFRPLPCPDFTCSSQQ